MVGAQMPAHQQSEEEEAALKKNIDCVYFLASPLTCKKGAECEYRHSEIARVNPRDCWYWLNGSCLNPKCAFRHPPLEGMLGPQVLPASSTSTLQPSQMIATSQPPIALSGAPSHYNSGKQLVPCIFFQKGFCLKGDRCSFSHGVNNPPPLQGPPPAAVVASITTTFPEPPSTLKKSPFAGLKRCTTEPRAAVEAHIPPPKPTTKVPLQAPSPPSETDPQSMNGRHSSRLDDDIKYRPTPSPCVNGDLSIRRTNLVHQVRSPDDYDALNSEDAEQNSREFSPGFDVLVDDDDEQRGSEYYQDKDSYERTREGHEEGRCLTPVNGYDVGSHSGNHKDYDSFGDADRDNMYRDPRRYDSFDRSTGGQYGRDQRRVSSGVSQRIRYPPREGDYQDRVDGSDLRNRLSKQREVNGLRLVKSHDRDRDDRDQSYRGPTSRRVTHHLNASERIVSDRLRGRIKLPGRSTSPLSESDVHRDRARSNSRGRLSPGRLHGFGHQGGSFQDRLKGRVHENTYDGGREFRGPLTREMSFDQNINFAVLKRLSELRGKKGNEYIKKPINVHQERLPLGKRKYSESYQQAENDTSFEGPKPLVEILKRKRGVDGNEEESNGGSKGSKELGEDTKATNERTLERDTSDLQMEEGLIIDGEGEYQEHEEAYVEEEGEYEYEQVEGEEDYKEDEAENEEGEYAEDDDVDDFAKKIGILFS